MMKSLCWILGRVPGIFGLILFFHNCAIAQLPNTGIVERLAAPLPWFMAECGAKAQAQPDKGSMTVAGKQGWMFLRSELRHVSVGKFWGETAQQVSRATRPDCADPLPAILDFKAQLDKRGIELILVPVPPKVTVYPDMLTDKVQVEQGGAPHRLDVVHQQFYQLLRDQGVQVLDLAPELMLRRFDKKGAMYCKQDSHWSGRACILAARVIGDEIKKRPWFKDCKQEKLDCEEKEVEITGDLWKDLASEEIPKERLMLRFVGIKKEGGLEPVTSDKTSPVILLGDSHNLIFHGGDDMQAAGAGLADQLALELGFLVDLIAVRGSGATPARINLYRRSKTDKDYLASKRLVVWCFSAREFTESTGWEKVPIAP